ncbi:MAG: RNase adapter RapZ [Synergistaceae bacterium]|jgi:UPF0042 nucleotide-binding protein|nr:RNase adapter RapZ [Synergistaceae bacterium]
MPETSGSFVDKIVIITGMSGGGKSTALHILEDQGFFAIDNIPPSLLPQLVEVLGKHRAAVLHGVAAVVDIRGDDLLRDLEAVLEGLRRRLTSVTLLFMDASDSALIRRFECTRRRHPLGPDLSTLEGIQRERESLAPIREASDVVLDTTGSNLSELRGRVLESLGTPPGRLTVFLTSFGYKHGIPQDCDYLVDVRFLSNPYYEAGLRALSGKDPAVVEYILKASPAAVEFLSKQKELFEFLFPLYEGTGKTQIHIAVGCTGGRHRSVAVVEWFASRLEQTGVSCVVRHRDIDREQTW